MGAVSARPAASITAVPAPGLQRFGHWPTGCDLKQPGLQHTCLPWEQDWPGTADVQPRDMLNPKQIGSPSGFLLVMPASSRGMRGSPRFWPLPFPFGALFGRAPWFEALRLRWFISFLRSTSLDKSFVSIDEVAELRALGRPGAPPEAEGEEPLARGRGARKRRIRRSDMHSSQAA